VKLAKELCRVATGRTVYLLDEPTTGLHPADIQKLLEVLQRLVDAEHGHRHRAQPGRGEDGGLDCGPGTGGWGCGGMWWRKAGEEVVEVRAATRRGASPGAEPGRPAPTASFTRLASLRRR